MFTTMSWKDDHTKMKDERLKSTERPVVHRPRMSTMETKLTSLQAHLLNEQILQQTGPASHLVRMGSKIHYGHVNHLCT